MKYNEIISGDYVLEHAKPVAGFMVRADDPNQGGNCPSAFSWSSKFKTQPGKANDVVEALEENLPYKSSEPETTSFLILQGTDEEDVVYVCERYTSEFALRDVHHQSAGYARLREKTGPLIKTRTIDGYHEVAAFLTKQGGMI